MASVLIVYGTSHGQTARVVQRIKQHLRQEGHRVSMWKGDMVPSEASTLGFDAYLVAGSVRFGRHQRYLEDFVRGNLGLLNSTPSSFVSVCGALAGSSARGGKEAGEYVASFLEHTGWRPRLTRSFAGGLPYTQYGTLTRWMMQLISRATGRPTDASRDWDLTDWDAVDSFAAELATSLGAPAVLPDAMSETSGSARP
jgi:menaquinone-dependent protoporphyrinogen oxidase